jgi:hypothetical protein
MTAPSYARQPGPRGRKGRRKIVARRRRPTDEPACRRVRIEPSHDPDMLLDVVEYVHEHVADLARRPQQAGVVPIGPNGAATATQPIHEAGDSDGEPAHTTLEPRRPVRLHQQMQMILLDAELQNAEPLARPGTERVPDGNEKPFAPEGRDIGARPERDVGRTSRFVWGAAHMRYVPAPLARLAAGAIASAAPGLRAELQLLRSTSHLEFGRKLSFHHGAVNTARRASAPPFAPSGPDAGHRSTRRSRRGSGGAEAPRTARQHRQHDDDDHPERVVVYLRVRAGARRRSDDSVDGGSRASVVASPRRNTVPGPSRRRTGCGLRDREALSPSGGS